MPSGHFQTGFSIERGLGKEAYPVCIELRLKPDGSEGPLRHFARCQWQSHAKTQAGNGSIMDRLMD